MRLRNRLHIGLQHISLFLFFSFKRRKTYYQKKKKKGKKEGKKPKTKPKGKEKGTIHIGKKQYTRKYCCTQ